ncbi:MAG: SMC-Scp complex subunit ScpB [SAR86 cluster bacterium]|jgi:segregation and condensation protein B|nr:SMC-Scp complex subunit ScpB [SAR86 cluster bacterium]|tara:strand:- start:275 stop:880 length:606 start_codon:yes stop_codon:yes gene_type:complete
MEHKISQVIEAVLLSASRPIDVQEIERVFPEDEKPTREEIRQALQEIEEQCKDRGVELKKVSSGYRLQVRQSLSSYVAKLWEERPQRFSKATLETLALIAYRQPITRGEIEEIRGVTIGTQLMRGLMERGWVKIVGQRDVPGRPSLYSTTKEFLDYFGLQHLRELPELPELPDLQSLDMELPLEADNSSTDKEEMPVQSLN